MYKSIYLAIYWILSKETLRKGRKRQFHSLKGWRNK